MTAHVLFGAAVACFPFSFAFLSTSPFTNRIQTALLDAVMGVLVRQYEERDLSMVKTLFTAYHTSLPIDISYQNYEDEFNSLPGKYVASKRGALFLAEKRSDEPAPSSDGGTHPHVTPTPPPSVLGCVALRTMDDSTCELKRLYVVPDARGLCVGLALVEAVVEEARKLHYRRILLDTLPSMKSAIGLYERCGFVQVPRYYQTPIEETVFLERTLD